MDFPREDEFESYGVHHIYMNFLYMLKDRGVDVEKYIKANKGLTEKEFWDKNEFQDLNQTYYMLNDKNKTGRKYKTYWLKPGSGKKISVDAFISDLKDKDVELENTNIIFISEKPLNTSLATKLKDNAKIGKATGLTLEVFTYARLLYRVSDHIAIDKIEILGRDEVMTIMNNLGITPQNFPMMSTGDMVARYFGLKAGDVIRVYTNNQHIGRGIDYRMVVPVDFLGNPIDDIEIFDKKSSTKDE